MPWTYPDIPCLHPDMMVTTECPGYSLTSTEVYPVYPDYPLIYGKKPISTLRTPWHSLMVTWRSCIPTDIPYWYGHFFFKEYSKEVEILFFRSTERHAYAITNISVIILQNNYKKKKIWEYSSLELEIATLTIYQRVLYYFPILIFVGVLSWNKMFCADFLNILFVYCSSLYHFSHLIINPNKNVVWNRLPIFKVKPADQTHLILNNITYEKKSLKIRLKVRVKAQHVFGGWNEYLKMCLSLCSSKTKIMY